MILAPHILIGSAIMVVSPAPFVGMPLAVASHYALDALPHSHYSISPLKKFLRKETGLKEALPTLLRVGLDGGIGIGGAVALALFFDHSAVATFWGGVAGALPDGLTILLLLLPGSSLLFQHNRFHEWIHHPVAKNTEHHYEETPPAHLWGIGLQIVTVSLAFLLFAKF